jgi:hypothetical protein
MDIHQLAVVLSPGLVDSINAGDLATRWGEVFKFLEPLFHRGQRAMASEHLGDVLPQAHSPRGGTKP